MNKPTGHDSQRSSKRTCDTHLEAPILERLAPAGLHDKAITGRRDTPRLRVEIITNTNCLSEPEQQAQFNEIQRALRKLLLDAGIDLAAAASTYQNDSDNTASKPILLDTVL